MSARTKINAIMLGAALFAATIAGALTQSWLVFVAVAIVSTVLMIHAGEVRIRMGDHRLMGKRKLEKF